MKLHIKKGATSNILQVFIADSSSTTGAGLTGLVFNTASLTAYYHRDTDTTATAITLATMTVGTFTSSGFKEIDATNMPGWYQFCPPDASLATGAANVAFHLKGATNMAPLPIEVQLVSYDPYDAVRLGLTALPNAAAEAAGGLFTRGTGAGQINQDANGRVDVSLKAILGTALTETSGQISAAFKQFFDVGTPTGTMKAITNVVTATNLTTNNDKTGYSLAAGQLFIKKNTALSGFTFPMFDSTTHQMVTGKTVTAQRSIDGGALASCANAVVEISNGYYKVDLANTDLNGAVIALKFSASGCDDLPYTLVTQA